VQLQVPLVILFAAFGAIMGDNVGYYIGLTGGRRLVERYGRFFFIKMEYLAAAERFFQRHGAKTVFFGRFISLLRIWSAFLAGMNRMNWRTFLIYNGLGGIVWATYNGILGYVAGRYFHEHFDQVEQLASTIGWIGFALVVVIGVGMFLFIRMRLKKFVTESAVEPAAAKREHTQVH
jgi:membrane protein DedA with SNARE-associated domain